MQLCFFAHQLPNGTWKKSYLAVECVSKKKTHNSNNKSNGGAEWMKSYVYLQESAIIFRES